MSILTALNEPRLRLAEVLGRSGVKLGNDLVEIHRDAIATRRCVFCNATPQCDAWLAGGERGGFADFCPNAGYIEQRTSARGG